MATPTTPMPDPQTQGASPSPETSTPPTPLPQSPDQGQQPQQPTSQAPANQMQMLLAAWYQTSKQIAASDPRLASAMEKISQGIQEAQTVLVMPPQQTPTTQQPMYS
jgi:hypothetical protein